ncbi:MAG TPA: hypothetical protein VNR89_18835 [Roseomonas sp.]|nr:hypothetical protein [Roseomonas sp.]
MPRQVAVDYAANGIACNAIATDKIQMGQPGREMDLAVLDRAMRHTPWP